jgi:hypothetical protein
MALPDYLLHRQGSRPIGAGTHAMLDYLTAGGFLMLGWRLRHHRRAAGLAFANAGAVLAASLLTDYPGGVVRRLTFEQHGKLDVAQAALCVAGPALLGFAGSPEARPFYAQAGVETIIVSKTDFDDTSRRPPQSASTETVSDRGTRSIGIRPAPIPATRREWNGDL